MTVTSTTTARLQGECGYCPGTVHSGQCPKVKAIEYFPDGSVKRVEFHPPNAWYPQPLPWVYPQPAGPKTYEVWCGTPAGSGVCSAANGITSYLFTV